MPLNHAAAREGRPGRPCSRVPFVRLPPTPLRSAACHTHLAGAPRRSSPLGGPQAPPRRTRSRRGADTCGTEIHVGRPVHGASACLNQARLPRAYTACTTLQAHSDSRNSERVAQVASLHSLRPPLPPCSLRRGGCPTAHLELIGGSWQPACNAAAGLVFAAASQGSIRPMARLICTCERV